MKTQIEITIDNETYLAEVEYFFYSEEESSYEKEYCNIESITFNNNISTRYGYPIEIGKDCNDLIQILYPKTYEKVEESCLRDYKHKQHLYWASTQED